MSYTSTILITGGTLGLGNECALQLARSQPKCLIILASRSDPKSSAAQLNKTLKQKNTIFLPLDLSKLDNVRLFCSTFAKSAYAPISALLLNAGLQFPNELVKTEAGVESTFAVNHVGHALLYHLLAPHLAENARIVITSSGTHDPAQKSRLPDAVYTSAEMLAHPTGEWATLKDGRQRYATSKLVNVLWMYALQRRLEEEQEGKKSKITVTAMDPGLMPGTGLAREYTGLLGIVAGSFLWWHILPRLVPFVRRLTGARIYTSRESATSLARLAVSPDVVGISGAYFEGEKEIKTSIDSYDLAKQEDLWAWTVKNIAVGEVERKKFDGGL